MRQKVTLGLELEGVSLTPDSPTFELHRRGILAKIIGAITVVVHHRADLRGGSRRRQGEMTPH